MLSGDDFALLERLRAANAEREKDPRFRAIRKKAAASSGEGEPDGEDINYAFSHEELLSGVYKGKSTKLEKIKKALEGKHFERYNSGHKGGLTNTEQKRKKNYLMVRRGKKSIHGLSQKANSTERWEKLNRKTQTKRDKRKRRRT